jgi:hypothetical protein
VLHSGQTIVVFVTNNHASKLAWKMAKAFAKPLVDTLQLVTCVMDEDSR